MMRAVGEDDSISINISKEFLGSSALIKHNNNAYTANVKCVSLGTILKKNKNL